MDLCFLGKAYQKRREFESLDLEKERIPETEGTPRPGWELLFISYTHTPTYPRGYTGRDSIAYS